MSSRERRRTRQRVRGRTARKLRATLVVAGGLGCAMGLVMVVYGFRQDNEKLRLIGVVYILLALGVLAVRQAMAASAEARKADGESGRGGGKQGMGDSAGGQVETPGVSRH